MLTHSFKPISLTLRRTLLLTFILLGLVPTAALSWLSFTRTRDAMTDQIRSNLSVQARGIQSDIDQMVFERFENAAVWSRSELMQDLRLGDVDKRVSNYLAGLQAGYGEVYRSMDCLTDDGHIIASSSPSRIGMAQSRPDPGRISVDARLSGMDARLSLPATPTLDDAAPITIETDIPSLYGAPSPPAAHLRLAFNVQQISRLLDAAAIGRRVIIVIDGQGRWIAGSRALRGRAMPDERALAVSLAFAGASSAPVTRDAPWLASPALMGRGPSMRSASFAGSGWTTLVFEPVDEALAPVSEMAWIFAGLLAAVFLATMLTAGWIAEAISRPIAALTERTRLHQRGIQAVSDRPAESRIVELNVLAHAYDDMVRAVEDSRRELVRTSKMAMLGELAAVLAHEVRTPLGILRSSAQILRRNPGLGPEGIELMTFIESETERLNRLVSTMLSTARPRDPELIVCDMHALLRRCAQMHDLGRGAEGITHPVLLELTSSDPAIPADAEQMMQVLFNLLSNARQATGPTGTVKLTTFDRPGAMCIVCADNGHGILPELVDRLFDPFVSGRDGGFGLGLAVVRQVVVAHHGAIAVGQSSWGGASFTIQLPRPARGRMQET